MIYAAFALWVFAIIFAARGTLNLWNSLTNSKYVAWALLPGTLVSELGYFLACLLTGAEFQGKKLVEGTDAKPAGKGDGAKGGVPYLTPLLAGLLPLAACFALVYVISSACGHPGYQWYVERGQAVPKVLPSDSVSFWKFLQDQVYLLQDGWRSLTEALNAWPWQNWRGWLLEYLLVCLVLRMAPSKRPLRPTLAGAAVLALLTAGAVALFSSKQQWLTDLWPMLSYVWSTALLLLGMTLCIAGAVRLVKIVAGKESAGGEKKPSK